MENITRSGTCIELFKDVQPYDFFLKNSAHIDIPSYMVPKCFSGWFRAIVTRVPGRTSHNYLQAHGSKRSKSKVHPGNEEILATVTDKYSIICRLEKTLVCAVNAFEMFNSTSVARKRAPPFLLYGVHSFKSF